MLKELTDYIKVIGTAVTESMEAGSGFRIGSPDLQFALMKQDENLWIYFNRDQTIKIETKLCISGSAMIISSIIENTGKITTAPINIIEPLYIIFQQPSEVWRHIFSNGGTSESYYPPEAYRTHEWSHSMETLTIESHAAGRSSNLHLPVLISLLNLNKESEGLFCGMEWSASWYIRFERLDNKKSSLSAGIKVKGLELEPGESLKLPDVHLGFFAGGPDEGTNILRKYLYDNCCAKYHGKPMIPRVSYDTWGGIENRINIELLKKEAVRAAELGVEVFAVDAGWFIGEFPEGVGNWDEVDKHKFPDGLEALSECVEKLGMAFGLWFEPERVVEGTNMAKINPDWIVQIPSPPWCKKATFHLNLARVDVQDYLIDLIGTWIKKLNLKWSRWDYNIEPADFWNAADPTLKIQFEYIKGLYRVLDTLIERYPDWMVEGCASGGRRIDIGTMKRAHTLWFSDQSDNPLLCRYMQARANLFLPGHLLNSTVMTLLGQGNSHLNSTSILSRMLGKLAFDGDIASWSSGFTSEAAIWVKEFKDIRHLLSQDFYQLLPIPTTLHDWDAVQFVDYLQDETVLFVFAGNQGGNKAIKLKGLKGTENYRINKRPDGVSKYVSGFELLEHGVNIKLEPYEGSLWKIQRV